MKFHPRDQSGTSFNYTDKERLNNVLLIRLNMPKHEVEAMINKAIKNIKVIRKSVNGNTL